MKYNNSQDVSISAVDSTFKFDIKDDDTLKISGHNSIHSQELVDDKPDYTPKYNNNYRDMYNTYDNQQLEYSYPYSFENKDYLNSKTTATYTWDFGDTVELRFDIEYTYTQYLITATVYNFRHEPIYEVSDYTDDNNIFYLSIDSELSSQIFPKGRYYCQLQASTPINDSENYITTIMSSDSCTFYVR